VINSGPFQMPLRRQNMCDLSGYLYRFSRLLLVCIFLYPAVHAAPLQVIDDRGQRIELANSPERIVSLLPSLTETVCALGACQKLVGTDRFSDWPEAVQGLPKLGGFEGVQIERLFALKPDVVLVAESARVIDRLESLDITVVALEPETLADVHRTVQTLGELLELSDAAKNLLIGIDSEIEAAANKIPASWLGARAYYEVSPSIHAAGQASFIGELLSKLGMSNIVPADLGPFPKLNPEYVVREKPDLILGSLRAISQMPLRPGWGSLPALKEGHTCGFVHAQTNVLSRPGPRLGEAANILADCITALPSRAAIP